MRLGRAALLVLWALVLTAPLGRVADSQAVQRAAPPTPFTPFTPPGNVSIAAHGIASRGVPWSEVRAWGLPPPRTGEEAFGRARMIPSTPVTDLPPGPKRDRLSALAEAYVQEHPDVELRNVRFESAIDDCAALEAKARDAANADAARQKKQRAADLHVDLGAPVRVDTAGGCPHLAAGSGLPIDVDTMTESVRVDLMLWFDTTHAR